MTIRIIPLVFDTQQARTIIVESQYSVHRGYFFFEGFPIVFQMFFVNHYSGQKEQFFSFSDGQSLTRRQAELSVYVRTSKIQ